MSAPGPSATRTAGWWWSARTRPSSASSTTSTTCAAPPRELGVAYPVVIDNDFAIWRAFDNHYWPALYLVDGDGRVRFQHFGEEAYAESEEPSRSCWASTRSSSRSTPAACRWPPTGTRSARPRRTSARRAAIAAATAGEHRSTSGSSPAAGPWARSPRCSRPARSLAYRFEARDLNLVMGGGGRAFTVRLDGEPPGDDRGLDVDASGEGEIDRAADVPARSPARRPPSGRSRSRSTSPACAPTSSRSARRPATPARRAAACRATPC